MYIPLRIGRRANGLWPSLEGALHPVVLDKVVAQNTPRMNGIGLIEDVQGPTRIRRVEEILVARRAPHAGRQYRGFRGAAGRRALGGQATEEPAARLLHRVQLPRGDAILLLEVLARVMGRCAPIIPIHVAQTAASVKINLGRYVHLEPKKRETNATLSRLLYGSLADGICVMRRRV